MMNALGKRCEGRIMTSSTRDIPHSKHILGFLDDKTQYANDWKNNNIVKITNNIQYTTQSLRELLYTSGGKLKISKYYMTIMAWTHDIDSTLLLLPTNKNNTISVTDSKDHKTYEISLLKRKRIIQISINNIYHRR